MGYSKYVGRVGALAVALGVGSAIAAAPAWAEPESAPSGSESSPSTSAGTSGTTSPSTESPTTGSGSDGSSPPNSSPTSPVSSVNGEVVSPTQPKTTKPAKPKKKSSKTTDKTADKTETTTPKPSSAQQDSTTPAATSPKPSSTTAPQSAPAATTSKPAQTVNTFVAPAVSSPVVASTPAATVKATALSGVTSPFDASGGTGGPAESPVSWVVLAASRKELDSLLTGSAPVSTGSQTTTGQAVVNAAAAPVVNQPPVVNPSSTSVDPTTGTITGTMGASDPENKKLTYSLKSGPTTGKLAFDAKTGTFTYTPTTAQRILAAVGSPQTAKFTATVSDGVAANVKTVEVTLTVSPAPITDKGAINAGALTSDSSVTITNTRAYVTNFDDHTITVVDTVNRQAIGTITLPERPSSVVATLDGKKLYVSDDTTNLVYVYNATAATPTLLKTIDFGESRFPISLATSPDDKTLYATGGLYDAKTDQWNAVVTKISTTNDKITGTVKVPGAYDYFYDLAFTPDGKKIYVIADLLTDDPDAVAPSALYVFSSTSTTAKQIATGAWYIGMTISPDGKRLYVNDVDAGTVSVFDTKTDKVVDTFSTPISTLSGFTASRDGTVLYAVDTTTNSVVAFETLSGNYDQLATAPVGSTTVDFYPGALLSPDGQELYYVSDQGLQVISLVPANAFPTVTPTLNTPGTTGVVTGAVGGNDTNGDPLKYTTTGAPTKGTLVLNAATGAFTYTPTAAARHAASALTATTADKTDTFTVTVDDGRRGIVTKTITVNILSANVAPTVKTTVGKPNSTTGVATGSVVGTDKDKDVLTYTGPVGTTPKGGTVTVDAKGKFVYTPTAEARHAAAATGASTADKTDSFIVTVADGHGDPVTVTVSVKIAPANAKPTGASASVAQPNSNGAVIGTITAVDADHDDFTLTGPASTKKGTITYDSATDSFVFTPTAAARLAAGAANASAATKTDTFTVTILDGHGGTTTTSVKVNIAPNVAPTTGSSTISGPGGDQAVVTGTAHATDPDGDTLTYGLKSPSSAGEVVVDAQTGQWAFKPSGQARFNAFFTPASDTANFSIVASDGKGGTTEIKVIAPVDPAVVLAYDDIRDLQAGQPAGIAVAADGTLYVSHYGQLSGEGGLSVLRPDGSTGTVSLDGNPTFGVVIGKDGAVYTTTSVTTGLNTTAGQVWRIDPATGTPKLFATLPNGALAIAVDGAGKLNVSSTNFATGKSTISVLSATGAVTKTYAVDGVVAGLAAGPGNKLYATASAVNGSTGSLVIISSNGTRKTVNLGSAAYGVAVDSAGRAYVSTVEIDSSGAPSAGFLKIVNPDLSVTAPISLESQGWLGLTFAPGGKLWGTDAFANTANQIELVQPWQGDYQTGEFDDATGAIHGVVLALDPGHHFTYSVTTNVDPSVGTVTVDAATGDWVFTPTLEARQDATLANEEVWKTFVITGSYGQTVKPVEIEVWIAPLYDGDLEYQTSTTNVAFVPFGLSTTADGRLVTTGLDGVNQNTGTLNVLQANGSFATTNLGFPSAGVVVRPDGKALVTDFVGGRVMIFDFGNPATSTVFATGLPSATGIALDGNGRVYVTSSVQESHSGKLVALNANGTTAWAVDLPTQANSVAIGPDGSVYVVTSPQDGSSAASILRYSSGGTALGTLDLDVVYPTAVAVASNGTMYVSTAFDGVHVISPDGSTQTIDVARSGNIAIGSDGRIYVTGTSTDENGNLIGTITIIKRVPAGSIV